jgi:pyruvate/2-oxoglutarate/acetoin dehydrogenase E1 component
LRKKHTYKELLTEAMDTIALKEGSVFCGQAVAVEGTALRGTLLNIPQNKLIEFPVDEDFQMGFCIGLAYSGLLPVCIFPRWNFLLAATNQIVNYLDKLKDLSKLSTPPKVIIRTAIGSKVPLNPGVQHIGDYTHQFKSLLNNVAVIRLDSKSQIKSEYEKAVDRNDGVSTILVEHTDLYNS